MTTKPSTALADLLEKGADTDLLHKAHVLNIKGRSYRLRDLKQTLGTVRS